MAGKHPLVEQYLERLSIEAFKDFRDQIMRIAKGRRGIYALYKEERLYYVGLAADLHSRVSRHLSDMHARKWNRFSLYLVRDKDHVREIEALLIRLAKPKGNRLVTVLPRSDDLLPDLRRELDDCHRQRVARILPDFAQPRRPKSSASSVTRRVATPMSKTPPLKGMLPAGTRIYASYKGRHVTGQVLRTGRIRVGRELFNSPSGAGMAVKGKATDGWRFWKYRSHGKLVPLKSLRQD